MDLIYEGTKARRGHLHGICIRQPGLVNSALPRDNGRSPQNDARSKGLGSRIPADRRAIGWVTGIVPVGEVVTHARGVLLRKMTDPAVSLARVPVA
jgi:hypothetical protein